jgi:hypothetical protein
MIRLPHRRRTRRQNYYDAAQIRDGNFSDTSRRSLGRPSLQHRLPLIASRIRLRSSPFRGPSLARHHGMMTTALPRKTPPSLETESPCLVRWVFRRGADALTCAVDASGARPSFDVCILPHWNLGAAAVEHFNAPSSALRRHAEIARHLRQSGWVAQYGASPVTGVAA